MYFESSMEEVKNTPAFEYFAEAALAEVGPPRLTHKNTSVTHYSYLVTHYNYIVTPARHAGGSVVRVHYRPRS